MATKKRTDKYSNRIMNSKNYIALRNIFDNYTTTTVPKQKDVVVFEVSEEDLCSFHCAQYCAVVFSFVPLFVVL